MTNEEAKFLLQGYRPGGRDAQDPQFADALEQVKRDPALEQWFREQQAFDDAVSDKLRSVSVPASLKPDILAGRKTIHPTAWWTRRPVVAAMAACLVAMLGLSAILLAPADRQPFQSFRNEMVSFVQDVEQRRESLQLKTNDVAAIQDWIARNSTHKDLRLPLHLTADSGVGCRVMDWNGQSVVLACFRLECGQVAHLLVINRDSIKDGPLPGAQAIALINGMNTAAWECDSESYLLVSSAPREELLRLL